MGTSQPEPSLLVLADDLTGAADCAARCFAAGLPSQIQLGVGEDILSEPSAHGALSFSSDSRHLTPGAAADRVRSLLASLVHRQDVRWYKKIDSTLRGNIGAELDAMLDSLAAVGRALPAVVSPAFPAQGRGLEEGRLVYAEASQATHLPSLLGQQSRRKVAHIALAAVRGGLDALAAQMAALRASGVDLFAVDAMADEDLETLHAAALAALGDALFCGSAGLVSVLARRMARAVGPVARAAVSAPPLPDAVGPVIVAVGSGSAMARAQIARLAVVPGCLALEIGGERVAGPPPAQAGVNMLLYHLPEPAENTAVEGPQARAMAGLLAEAVLEAIDRTGANRLVVVGGDTAVHVLARLGVASLAVARELQPGMPLAIGQAGGRPRAVVLKAGNHGDADSLVRIVSDLTAGAGV